MVVNLCPVFFLLFCSVCVHVCVYVYVYIFVFFFCPQIIAGIIQCSPKRKVY